MERIIGPLPGLKEARAISTLALIAGAILCAASLYFGFHGETFMGRPLGGDFVQFYSAGKILNTGDAAGIYDISTIVRVEHESLPTMPDTQMLLYGNAPYIAALFRPLALLPYRYAYCVWLAISLLLYSTALVILIGDRLPRVAYLLALSSPMFLLETWIGGQISVIAFLGIALFVDCFRRERWFLAGLSLSMAAYKPSLIAIPAVMLVIGACWRSGRGSNRRVGTGRGAFACHRRLRRVRPLDRYVARIRIAGHWGSSFHPANQVCGLQLVLFDSVRRQRNRPRLRSHRDAGGAAVARARLVEIGRRPATASGRNARPDARCQFLRAGL